MVDGCYRMALIVLWNDRQCEKMTDDVKNISSKAGKADKAMKVLYDYYNAHSDYVSVICNPPISLL